MARITGGVFQGAGRAGNSSRWRGRSSFTVSERTGGRWRRPAVRTTGFSIVARRERNSRVERLSRVPDLRFTRGAPTSPTPSEREIHLSSTRAGKPACTTVLYPEDVHQAQVPTSRPRRPDRHRQGNRAHRQGLPRRSLSSTTRESEADHRDSLNPRSISRRQMPCSSRIAVSGSGRLLTALTTQKFRAPWRRLRKVPLSIRQGRRPGRDDRRIVPSVGREPGREPPWSGGEHGRPDVVGRQARRMSASCSLWVERPNRLPAPATCARLGEGQVALARWTPSASTSRAIVTSSLTMNRVSLRG